MTPEETPMIDTLKALIELNLDGAKGYRTAAEAVSVADYAATLHQQAAEREQFAGTLSDLLENQTGIQAPVSGSSAGVLHRMWLNVQAAVGGDNAAVVAECKRGDESVLKRYQEALRAPLPEAVMAVLRTQYKRLERAYEEVSILHTAIQEQNKQ